MDFLSYKAWRKALALVAFLIVFAAAIFRLPYHFPVTPSQSDSYLYQFNNRVAVIIFLIGAAVFAILFRGLSLQPATKDSRVSRLSPLIAIVLCVGTGWFYWVSSSRFGLQGENIYFYGRLAQLAAGKTIYKDFEFAYGPLLLYLPYWTGKLLHLSLIDGYVVFWLINWAVGIWLIFLLVNAIAIPNPHRNLIFFIFALDCGQMLWPEGVNYTPFRFCVTGGLALLVYAAHDRGYRPLAVASLAVLGAAIATGVSPEHGLAFMLGTTLFFLVCVRRRPAGFWISIAVMNAAFLAIVIASARAGLYITLRSFASGGYNYPIMPSPGVLCILAMLLIAACVAYLGFQRKQSDSLALYLLCLCMFTLPSGFGRADSGHMQIAVFSALIVAALALGRYPWISLAVGIAFVYWPGTAQYRSDYPVIREAAEQRIFGPSATSSKLYRPIVFFFHLLDRDSRREAIEQKAARYYPVPSSSPIPEGNGIFDAPLGLTINGYTDTTGRVDYGYFSGSENVIVPSQVERVISWLNAHPERDLLLVSRWHDICRPANESLFSQYENVYGFHWASLKRSESIYLPLCQFIDMRYAPAAHPVAPNWTRWHRTNFSGNNHLPSSSQSVSDTSR